jgi:hypothetical protein
VWEQGPGAGGILAASARLKLCTARDFTGCGKSRGWVGPGFSPDTRAQNKFGAYGGVAPTIAPAESRKSAFGSQRIQSIRSCYDTDSYGTQFGAVVLTQTLKAKEFARLMSRLQPGPTPAGFSAAC